MTTDGARAVALALPDVIESSHFENADFRIGGKIFATLPGDDCMNLRLPLDEQSAVVATDRAACSLPGIWGRRGWTAVTLSSANPEELRELIEIAWRYRAPKKLLIAHGMSQWSSRGTSLCVS